MSVQEPAPPASAPEDIVFAAFRLDRRAGRLLRAGESLPLRPKTWAVLLYLAERPGALVTKEELLDAVWPDVAVTPDTLTKSIGELRLALGDDSRTPRCIETVHRRGFRFIAGLGSTDRRGHAAAPSSGGGSAQPFVGRVAEMARLRELFAKACGGERQMVFVTGAVGVGKTTLLDAFLQSSEVADAGATVWIGRGSCVEQHGTREPYMPVLDALGRMARRADAARLVELLPRVAPTWLAQMPWLIGDDDEGLRRSLQSVRPERMLREFAALTEVLSEEVTLVLVLEDLHWGDPSTVDLLSVLAQREESARLLVLASYRPAELAVQDHVLARAVRTLRVRRQCVEIPLHELDRGAVHEYLEERFPGAGFVAELAPQLLAYTDGTPLFLVALVEHFLARGWILDTAPGWALAVASPMADLSLPDEARRVIETQFEMLDPTERGLLEVASVAGHEFSVAVVADAAPCAVDEVERRFDALVRTNRFLRATGEAGWPDARLARGFSFTHELYRRAAYAEIPEARRRRLHQRVGEALERIYGPRAAEIAPELAAHFESAGDVARAIRYLAAAAARARRRFASREAIAYLESAVTCAALLQDASARDRCELDLRLALAAPLSDLHGFASAPVRRNGERARALCERVGSPEQLFEMEFILCHLHFVRGDRSAAREGLARLDELANRLGTRAHRFCVDSLLVRAAFLDARFADACRLAEALLSSPPAESPGPIGFGADPLLASQSQYGIALWMRGFVGEGRRATQASLAAARQAGSPFTLASATFFAAMVEVLGRNPQAAAAQAGDAMALCAEHGFAFGHALASALNGSARLQRGECVEALAELEASLVAVEDAGALLFTTYILAFIAEAHLRLGAFAEGVAAIDRALARAESDPTYVSELWRLKGELLLGAAKTSGRARRAAPRGVVWRDAEACLLRALELSHALEARSFELRAATSLARAWRGRGRVAEAAALLTDICRWFEASPSTPDLAEANAVLAELASAARPLSSPGRECRD